jgi:arginyl-tRNA synthetase
MLGADHHGYVQRLMAMTAAFGDEPYVNLQILIGQLVLVKDGTPAHVEARRQHHDGRPRRDRRRGCRALRSRDPADSPSTLDPDVLQKRTNDNPVFYVQYAHARTTWAATPPTRASTARRSRRSC